MKKTISIVILLGILIIAVLNLASAITIYSGDTYSFPSEEFEYYTVTGNSSNLEGMNITWENENTTISFSKYFAPDSFTLVFFNLEGEEIETPDCPVCSSGGGSSSTTYVDRNITIEVPNYIDREVEVIKIIETEGETIIEKKVPVWIWILSGFLVLTIFFLLWLGTRG